MSGFSNTGAGSDYQKKIYVKFPDTRPESLEAIGEGENPQFKIASGDNMNEPMGNSVAGKLISITHKTRASTFGNKLQAVISIATDLGTVEISSNMHNEMRKLLLKIAQVDKVTDISIAVYYIKDATSGKRYFSTGIMADGVKLGSVQLDRDTEVANGTIEKEESKTGKVTWYYDNPLSSTQEDLLGDPKFFDGMLLEKVSKLGEYHSNKAEMNSDEVDSEDYRDEAF